MSRSRKPTTRPTSSASTTSTSGAHDVFEFDTYGPPPDMKKRALIFDSLSAIISHSPAAGASSASLAASSSSSSSSSRKGKGMATSTSRTRGTHVFTWGAGYSGQLGRLSEERSSKKYSDQPEPVHLPVVVRAVSCGSNHTAVCTDSGEVYAWGESSDGQLGAIEVSLSASGGASGASGGGGASGASSKRSRKGKKGGKTRKRRARKPAGGGGEDSAQKQGVVNFRSKVEQPHRVAIKPFIVQVSCGGSHTLALSRSGICYAWGQNRSGQCGVGERGNKFANPKEVKSGSVRFQFVDAGHQHSMAIATDGRVYSFGSNEHGQSGQGDRPALTLGSHGRSKQEEGKNEILVPTLIDSVKDVTFKQVSCATIHSALVSTTGELYICGFGEHLYPGEEQHFFATPKKIKFKEHVQQVACGQSHVLVLTVGGDVYAFGGGKSGQVGHGAESDVTVPRLVMMGKHVAAVATGRYHSMALTKYGVVYTWGCGESGQLGHRKSADKVTIPTPIEGIIGCVVGQIACGEHHSACLTSAPWKKITADVSLWKDAALHEVALTRSLLKHGRVAPASDSPTAAPAAPAAPSTTGGSAKDLTKRGLSLKDHQAIAERMAAWCAEHKHELDAARSKEEDSIAQERAKLKRTSLITAEAQSVTEGVMRKLLQRSWSKRDVQKLISAMGVDDEPAPEADEDAADAKPEGDDGAPHLPPINTRQDPAAKSATDGGSRRVRALLSPRVDPGASGGAAESTSGARTARVARAPRLPEVSKRTARGRSRPRATTPQPTGSPQKIPVSPRSVSSDQGGDASGGVGRSEARTSFLKQASQTLADVKKLVSVKGASGRREQVRALNESVNGMRKEYDVVHHRRVATQARLKELKREKRLLRNSERQMESANAQGEEKLRALHMRVNTTTIQLKEEEENRKNYEQTIDHLKEGEMESRNRNGELREKIHNLKVFEKRVAEHELQAYEERNSAQAELVEFKGEIANYRAFMDEQLGRFSHVLASSKDQDAKRMNKASSADQRAHAAVEARVDGLHATLHEHEEECAMLEAKLGDLQRELNRQEEDMKKLRDATGLTDPEAIINKFHFKGDIREQLQMDVEDKTARIQELQAREKELRERFERAKERHHEKRWRDVDQLEDSSREAGVRAARAHSELERTSQLLVYAQEGVLSLLHSAEVASQQREQGAQDDTDQLGSVWTPGDAQRVIQRLEKVLSSLRKGVPAGSQ